MSAQADPDNIGVEFMEENLKGVVPSYLEGENVRPVRTNSRVGTPNGSDPGTPSSFTSLPRNASFFRPVPAKKAVPEQARAKPSFFQRLFKGNTFENLKSLEEQTVRQSLLNAYNSGDAKTVERIRKFLGKEDPLIETKILETIGFLESQGPSTNQKKVKKYEQLLAALGESVTNVNTYWSEEGGKRRTRKTRKQRKSKKTRKTRHSRK